MKRIETIEDVREAMQMNPYFYGYVMQICEDDVEYFNESYIDECNATLKECRTILADALDDSKTLARLHSYIKELEKKIEDTLENDWIPSFEDSIECSFGSRGDFDNIIIDNDKVYRLYECYAEHDDKTFIMREEFYPAIDDWDEREGEWEMPNQELVGWYCGSPADELTEEYYGK